MDTTDIVKQLTAERDRIDTVIKLLSGTRNATPAEGKKKPMSAAARKRISEAQRKRWAASKAAKDAVKSWRRRLRPKKVQVKKAIASKKAAPKKVPAKAMKAAAASTEAATS